MTNGTQKRQLQLGIIGTGLAVEKLHWPALKRMPERFRTVAFANRTRPKAEHFSQYSGVSMEGFTDDYEELLRRDDVEVVLISLPIPLNLSVTRAALEAGKHVICEKPAGSNEAEGREYVELVAKYPEQTVLVAENWFYRDDLRYARSLLDEGVIGRVHLVAWRTVSQLIPRAGQFSSTPWRHHPDYEGGAHLDGGVHHLAEIRLLCGDVARLAGETQDANTTHGGPSDLSLNLRFVSGAIGSYTAAYPELAVPAEPNDLRLYGTEGVMTLGREGTSIYRPDGSVETYRVEQMDGGYYNEFLNFHEAVTAGASLVGTAAQSYRNMELVLKGLASADAGQVISLDEWPISLAADAVPLWRPAGATNLFDGLEVKVTRETGQAG